MSAIVRSKFGKTEENLEEATVRETRRATWEKKLKEVKLEEVRARTTLASAKARTENV